MIPIRFARCNIVMKAPPGMPECSDVQAYRDKDHCVTAWRPTPEELVKINLGEPIYLVCHGGEMPPVSLIVDDPFENPQQESDQ